MSMAKTNTITPAIRCARDLIVRLESHPATAAEIEGIDRWQRWILMYAMKAFSAAGLDEWEWASLECIVKHSGREGRIPQEWLFDGGPDDDPRLRLAMLSDNARKQRITRFIDKVHKAGRRLGLDWKVERAADCSKAIYTNPTTANSFTLPRP
jgi:hypothetical protein